MEEKRVYGIVINVIIPLVAAVLGAVLGPYVGVYITERKESYSISLSKKMEQTSRDEKNNSNAEATGFRGCDIRVLDDIMRTKNEDKYDQKNVLSENYMKLESYQKVISDIVESSNNSEVNKEKVSRIMGEFSNFNGIWRVDSSVIWRASTYWINEIKKNEEEINTLEYSENMETLERKLRNLESDGYNFSGNVGLFCDFELDAQPKDVVLKFNGAVYAPVGKAATRLLEFGYYSDYNSGINEEKSNNNEEKPKNKEEKPKNKIISWSSGFSIHDDFYMEKVIYNGPSFSSFRESADLDQGFVGGEESFRIYQSGNLAPKDFRINPFTLQNKDNLFPKKFTIFFSVRDAWGGKETNGETIIDVYPGSVEVTYPPEFGLHLAW
jgi:hypothetical protein